MNIDRAEKQDGQGRTRQPEDVILKEMERSIRMDAEFFSDPDWRAWLGKPDNTDHFESEILCDTNGDFIVIPPHTKADKWLSGAKVKVTLELVEEP